MKHYINFSANMVGTKFNGIFCDPFCDEDDLPTGIGISPKLARYTDALTAFAQGDLQTWLDEYAQMSHSEKCHAQPKLEIRIQKRLDEIVKGN
jgi:hypothetical protein